MKKVFLIISSVCFASFIQAQNGYKMRIDTSNYYSYFKSDAGLGTNWLRENEVVPIIKEEMERAGLEAVKEYALYKFESGEYAVISVLSRKSNIGIVYLTGHTTLMSPKYRNVGVDQASLGIDLYQRFDKEKGGMDFVEIKKLPRNIYTLAENSYWYQYGDTENKEVVTKDVAIRLLRMDVKRILKEVMGSKD